MRHSDSHQYKGVQYCYRSKEGIGEGRERKPELGGREVARLLQGTVSFHQGFEFYSERSREPLNRGQHVFNM